MKNLPNWLLGVCALLLAAATTGPPARAQLLQLPDLTDPAAALPPTGVQPVDALVERLDPRDLADLRLLRIRALIKDNPRLIDTDPNGAPIVRSEVTAFAPSRDALQRAREAGFRVLRERRLDALGGSVVVLRAPDGWSTRRALRRLRELDPEGAYDFNHIYTGAGEVESGARTTPSNAYPTQSGPPPDAPRAGLIDGGVDASHPVFADAHIVSMSFVDAAPLPDDHGTAVASILLDQAGPVALYAADVYGSKPTGGAIDAIAAAFGWMAAEDVSVVNISLVGPPNATLKAVVRAAQRNGQTIVAAVGNDGPAAPPLYPAAYDGVIGVTGVDGKNKALIEACRGDHVDFAAPGADVAAAATGGLTAAVRGTSFAAPAVAGLIARDTARPDAVLAARAIAGLAADAADLGAPGRDAIYGAGLVRAHAALAAR